VNAHTHLQEEAMIQQAVNTLVDTLGPTETARFLTLPRRRVLDSVTRHRRWQDGLDRERFFDLDFGTGARDESTDAVTGQLQLSPPICACYDHSLRSAK